MSLVENWWFAYQLRRIVGKLRFPLQRETHLPAFSVKNRLSSCTNSIWLLTIEVWKLRNFCTKYYLKNTVVLVAAMFCDKEMCLTLFLCIYYTR